MADRRHQLITSIFTLFAACGFLASIAGFVLTLLGYLPDIMLMVCVIGLPIWSVFLFIAVMGRNSTNDPRPNVSAVAAMGGRGC